MWIDERAYKIGENVYYSCDENKFRNGVEAYEKAKAEGQSTSDKTDSPKQALDKTNGRG